MKCIFIHLVIYKYIIQNSYKLTFVFYKNTCIDEFFNLAFILRYLLSLTGLCFRALRIFETLHYKHLNIFSQWVWFTKHILYFYSDSES